MGKSNFDVIIHTGFMKCASTFLQMQVFPKLKNYKFYGNEKLPGSSPIRDLGRIYLEDMDKNNPIFNLPNMDGTLVSLENFMTFDLPLAWRKYGDRMRKEIFISNIKELFREKGKLIFVIRRQDSVIEDWLKYKPHFFKKPEYFFIDFPLTATVLDKNPTEF